MEWEAWGAESGYTGAKVSLARRWLHKGAKSASHRRCPLYAHHLVIKALSWAG